MRLLNWLWVWLLRKVGFMEAEAYLRWMADTWPTRSPV